MEYLKTVVISVVIVLLTMTMTVMQLLIFIPVALIQTDMYENLLEGQHFYGQIRQFSLKIMKENLRFDENRMPYLEAVLTEDFFKDSISEILDDMYLFVTGKESEIPAISIYKLKDEVYGVYNLGEYNKNKNDIVDYWLSPLPDNIRISYIMSTKPFWFFRYIMCNFRLLLTILIVLLLFMATVLTLCSYDIWQGILWTGTAIVSAAVIVVGISLLIVWLGGYSQISASVVRFIGQYGFPDNSISGLLKSLGRELGFRLNMIAIMFLAVGGIMMFFVPVKD